MTDQLTRLREIIALLADSANGNEGLAIEAYRIINALAPAPSEGLRAALDEAYDALNEMEMFSDDATGVVTVSKQGYADYERAFDVIERARALAATPAPSEGFAADRPSGPRTERGHALASSLRRRLPDVEIDYDSWIRDIEDAAEAWGKFRGMEAALAATPAPSDGLRDEDMPDFVNATVVPLNIWENDDFTVHGRFILDQLRAAGFTVIRRRL